jgi:hypothetical protein
MATYEGTPVTVNAPVTVPPQVQITTAQGEARTVPLKDVIFTQAEADTINKASEDEWLANREARRNSVTVGKLAKANPYSATTTYTHAARVSFGGETWTSNEDGNLGNTPAIGSSFWSVAVPLPVKK